MFTLLQAEPTNKSKAKGKNQESIRPSTTSDPGYHMGSFKNTSKHHTKACTTNLILVILKLLNNKEHALYLTISTNNDGSFFLDEAL